MMACFERQSATANTRAAYFTREVDLSDLQG